ncbi:MAG: universal stress protein [Acidobacteria bacterium]|nr:universal stress protein [Acidobacteriota bacterium]
MQTERLSTILCPVDFSDISGYALRAASRIAACSSAKLIAVHADWFEAPAYFTSGKIEEMKAEFQRDSAAAHQSLAAFVRDTLGESAAAVETRVVEGLPVDVILRLARETRADLVAMGTHGRSGVQKWMLGSVAERVIRESPAPVLTVRQAMGEARTVLCAVDDTDVSRRALTFAAAMSACLGARLTVLHVEEAGAAHPVADLCSWIPETELARCSLREVVRKGDASEEILKAAMEEHAGLVVMGAPRRRFFEGMVLGTTTVRTVRHAPCPVLTVPSGH